MFWFRIERAVFPMYLCLELKAIMRILSFTNYFLNTLLLFWTQLYILLSFYFIRSEAQHEITSSIVCFAKCLIFCMSELDKLLLSSLACRINPSDRNECCYPSSCPGNLSLSRSTAKRGRAEERQGAAGRCVCHRSRWCRPLNNRSQLINAQEGDLCLLSEVRCNLAGVQALSLLPQEVSLQQASWSRVASTWTPRASSLSTRYITMPAAWVKACYLVFLFFITLIL